MGQAPLEPSKGVSRDDGDYDPRKPRGRSSTAGEKDEVPDRRAGSTIRADRRDDVDDRQKQKEPQIMQLDLSNKGMTSDDMRLYFSKSAVGRKFTSSPSVSDSQPKSHNRRHSRSTSTSASSQGSSEALILTYLNLANNQLTYLEGLEDIQNLSLLQEIDLSFNQISNIQNSLFRGMGNLRRLNLAGNKLLYLPKGIGFLVNLTDLDISRNEIAQLGHEIGQLVKLESMNASYNQLSELPSSIAQLRHLKKLILTNNNLTYIDVQFNRLTELSWFDASWNKLVEFPRGLNMTIKKVYLGHNHIETLDGDDVAKLKSLRELSLRNNRLRTLPKELAVLKGVLTVLDLEGNRFKEKEYQETDVDLFLSWLEDPKANPIIFDKKEEAPMTKAATPAKEMRVASYTPSLYRFKGKSRIIIHKREVNVESLNDGDTFVLDVGKRLYLWYGKKSNKAERKMGTRFAHHIAQEEMGGVPVIEIKDKDKSPEAAEFWRVLGGDRRNIQTAEQGGDDGHFEQHFFDYVTLFKFSNVIGRIKVDEISGHESPFFKDMLNSDHTYVFNCDSSIFIWSGRHSVQKERNWALLKAEDLREKFQPYFCEVIWVIDGAEPLYFREQFIDWGIDSHHEKITMPDEEERLQILRREEEMQRILRERQLKAQLEHQEKEKLEKEKEEQEKLEQEKIEREREERERERRGLTVKDGGSDDEGSGADSDEDPHVIGKMTRKELAEYREAKRRARERRKKEKEKEEESEQERGIQEEAAQREREREEKERKEREARERKEKEEREREEKERKEKEQAKVKKEKEEKERKEREERERKEREKAEEEKKRKEREQKEKKEREEREKKEKQEKDKRDREERERKEREKADREIKEREERERRERERQEEEERKERMAREKEDEERRKEEERRELDRLAKKTKIQDEERNAKEERERKEREEREKERKEREERAKKAREDLERKAKEERERKEKEEKDKRDREEKARKEKEERERKAKEKKEKEEHERKEREEKERKERERKEREEKEKEKADRERKEKEEKERKEREEKEKKERAEKQRKEQEEQEKKDKDERSTAPSLGSLRANFQKTEEKEPVKPNFHVSKTSTFHKISTSAPVVAELEHDTSTTTPTTHAHATAATGGGGNKFATKSETCDVCSKRVYFSEKLAADGKTFHKTCFRCAHCNNTLKLGNYAALEGKMYCKPHFKQLFALKGNYAGGFGGKKPDEIWAENKKKEGTTGGSHVIAKSEPATPAPSHSTAGSAIVRPVTKPATTPSTPSGGSSIAGARQVFSGGASAPHHGGVSVTKMLSGTDAILYWAQKRTEGYKGVEITNFTTSWKDGLAFAALAHSYRPDLLDYSAVEKLGPGDRLEKAFSAFEAMGAIRLLDPEDITSLTVPDRLSMITYLGEVYKKTNKS